MEKVYLVCYPIFEKKETSCKEIVWGHSTQNYSDTRFLMNQEDRASSDTPEINPILAEIKTISKNYGLLRKPPRNRKFLITQKLRGAAVSFRVPLERQDRPND